MTKKKLTARDVLIVELEQRYVYRVNKLFNWQTVKYLKYATEDINILTKELLELQKGS